LKSDGLKNKLTQLAKEKQEAKGIKVQWFIISALQF
jgi:hypothetical protein